MTQADLERAVARATGETRQLIHRMGFSVVHAPKPCRRRRQRHGVVMPAAQRRTAPILQTA